MTIQTVTANEAAEVAPGRKRRLIHTSSLMAVAWDFSGGPWPQPDPQHAHPHEQLTYVLSGELLFFIGEGSRWLQAGDMVAVPSNPGAGPSAQ